MSVDRLDEQTGRSSQDLYREFLTPPSPAWPHVWWHWMNGNITKEGIDRDLSWLKRIGIRGLQNFDGSLETPRIVEHPLNYMMPGWQEAFRHAVAKAFEFGLEFGIASSPGWSETGGPWVRPESAMKKVVWSQIQVKAGDVPPHRLPRPPSVAGPYQNIPLSSGGVGLALGSGHYGDITVIAHRTPAAWAPDPAPILMRVGTAQKLIQLDPGAEDSFPIRLTVSGTEAAYVILDYGLPQVFRSLTLARCSQFSLARSLEWRVEASVDGNAFRLVMRLSADEALQHLTASFPPVEARYVRLSISPGPSDYWFEFAANAPGASAPEELFPQSSKIEILQLHLHRCLRVNHVEEKAGFATAARYYPLATCDSRPDEAVRVEDIVDVTHCMQPDGSLTWEAPDGEWTVTRFGYSLTGKTNHPASPEATGLEVDKLDKEAVGEYLLEYLEMFRRTVGDEWIGGRGIRTLVTDSIEARGQNWTGSLPLEFERRRGYPLNPWLVALTGVVIRDSRSTDAFLWDFRKTLMELLSENHYGTIARCSHEWGLTYYSESLEGYPTMAMGDDLDMRAPADVPMGALWTSYDRAKRDGIPNHICDVLGAASVARFYGKNLVAVEALTSGYEPWAFAPASLRPVVDLAFVLGANRPVVHTSVHQPSGDAPGITLGPYGQHFNRHESWAEFADSWILYLARNAYLLQQGTRVADVAYFYGEEGSLAGLCERGLPQDLPKAYGFDFVSREMLLNHLHADEGELVSSAGARYRLLYLGGNCTGMTLPVLRRLNALLDAGVRISGAAPTGSPSLSDDGKRSEYQRLLDELWGQRRVLSGATPDEVLKRLTIAPDFEYSGLPSEGRIMYSHREAGPAQIYYLTNRSDKEARFEARFRVTGMRPELWHADSGICEPTAWWTLGNVTCVNVRLGARKSVFVVFCVPASACEERILVATERILQQVTGTWELTFEPNRGAPDSRMLVDLASWSENDDSRVKYFSGIGIYHKMIDVEWQDLRAEDRILLDLGDVREVARVTVNGKEFDSLWDRPFRCDVTSAIRLGEPNAVGIQVANLWVNRLIGDRQPGARTVASVVTATYDATAPLRRSGLLGPVNLIRYTPARRVC